MSNKHRQLIADYEKYRSQVSEAAVGDESAEQRKARFNLMQKDFAKWFDYYFPSFKKRNER